MGAVDPAAEDALAPPLTQAVDPAAAPPKTHRGRLFRKYLLLILSLVSVGLLASGGISIYFTYRETSRALASLQQEKAVGAASRIEQYIRQVSQQLAYASLPQLDAGDVELRRIEFLKLLRQAPEVTDIALIGADGREQVAVSRLGMEQVGSGRDRSDEPAFKQAKRGQPWYGPVYFRKETEPYMTVALRSGSGDKGPVTVAELNLKFMWDVVSRIRVGDKGKAYVVDGNGFLVADPDIGLVLRKTSLAALQHVKAPVRGGDEPAMQSHDLAGTRVLAAMAPIELLDWKVFVEQPVSEVFAKLNDSILFTGALLLTGLAVSALAASALARSMVRPIRTLDEGARRIGAGELDQRIVVRTGDELEGLADEFNRMSAQLRESYAGLERKVAQRTAEVTEALDHQTAVSEVLGVMSRSPSDVAPVFEAIMQSARRLLGTATAAVFRFDGRQVHLVATHGWSAEAVQDAKRLYPGAPTRTMASGRAVLTGQVQAIADVRADPEYDSVTAKTGRWRRLLAAPMIKDGVALGVIAVSWPQPGETPPRQVELLKTFADQAVIAIENVRLFNETREALERQTATAEILKVISESPTDVQPVFEAIVRSGVPLFGGAAVAVSQPLAGQVVLRAFADGGSGLGQRWRDVFPFALTRDYMHGAALLDGRLIDVPDVLAEGTDFAVGRNNFVASGFRAATIAPMLRGTTAIGAIAVVRTDPGPLPPHQLELLRTFADQAVIAVENVRLFNETKEALERQTATAEVLRVISSSPTDVQPVIEAVALRSGMLCRAEGARLWLADGDVLRARTSYGGDYSDATQEDTLPATRSSIAGRAFVERRTVHVEDVLPLIDSEYPDVRALQAQYGFRTVLAVPMLREGQSIGVIALLRSRVQAFDADEMALVQTFADQAVIAIENVRLFREIQDKSRQLEIANQHKSEFLANMSHELRTPLNAIIGFSEVLIERMFGELNDKQDDYLKDIHSSGKHLLSLINDILDLSKIEAGRMELDVEAFDLPAALSNAMTLVRERAQRHGIALGLQVDPALGELRADERKFKQILLNLLSNAVKFTPDGGHVEVRAGLRDGVLEVAVSDTGIGIAKDDQAAVFEEFRQVGRHYTNKQEGTGLGLALTKRFVELHGGTLTLSSEPGRGSTFTFTLPSQV